MRSIVIAAAICVAPGDGMEWSAQAVGLTLSGKRIATVRLLLLEVSFPTLNKMTEALLLPQFAEVLDRIALEIKGMVDQVGRPPVAETASVGSRGGSDPGKAGGRRKTGQGRKSGCRKKPEKRQRKRTYTRQRQGKEEEKASQDAFQSHVGLPPLPGAHLNPLRREGIQMGRVVVGSASPTLLPGRVSGRVFRVHG